MPVGRHQGGHDHRRLSGDGQGDRAPGRPRCRRARHRRRTREAERRRAWQSACAPRPCFARIMPEQKLRIVNALKAQRRDRRDDRRRRQRRALAEGGAYRHRHGRSRHRRRARGLVDRPARRRFRLDRQGHPARPPHLRQSAQGDGLHLRRARADRGTGAAAAAVRPADPVRADPHRLSRDGHRSGLLARLRGRDRGGRRHAPSAARARRAAVLVAR